MATSFSVRSVNVEHFNNSLADTFMSDEGVPQDGVTGVNVAPVGATYTDTLTGLHYGNQGSTAYPTWVLLEDVNILTDSSALVFILVELRVISRLLAAASHSSDSPETIRADELSNLAGEVSLSANT